MRTVDVEPATDAQASHPGDAGNPQPLEQRLADSERRARLALEALRGHVYEIDLVTHAVRRSEGFGTLLGFAEHEVSDAADWWLARIVPEDRARIEAEGRAVMAARQPLASVEYRIRHRDGREIWLQEHARVEYDAGGRPLRVIGCTFDIDARKRAELALEAARARLQEATLAAGLGIHEYYPATGTLVWDERMRQWWGLDADEPVTYDKFVARVHPDDRAPMQAAVDRALDPQTGGRYEAEYRVLHPDGAVRWVHATGAVSFEDGRAVRLIGTVQDVTKDKRLAAELREVDRRKDEFLATLSHELRNPLAPIRTAVQILADPRVPAEQAGEARGILGRQVEHLALLLDDLLDLSRITQGKLALRRERVRLDSVVAAAVEAARPALDGRGHRLAVVLPPEPPLVDVDPLRLAQVLGNLLNNAAKYTDPGGSVVLDARVEGAELRLAVRDDGIGLTRDALAEVFRMFAQVAPVAGRADGGLGIGLALVRGLVELHGGSVAAFSDGPGRGSEFVVRMPVVVPASAAPDATAPPAPRTAGPGRRVLVVDDNRDAARTLALLLELDGHEVRVAHAGREALTVAGGFRPDVALVDIGLPDLDGHAVARAVRAEPWGATVELIALTGWGQADDKRRSAEAGFDRHFTKPVDPDELLRTLQHAREPRAGAT